MLWGIFLGHIKQRRLCQTATDLVQISAQSLYAVRLREAVDQQQQQLQFLSFPFCGHWCRYCCPKKKLLTFPTMLQLYGEFWWMWWWIENKFMWILKHTRVCVYLYIHYVYIILTHTHTHLLSESPTFRFHEGHRACVMRPRDIVSLSLLAHISHTRTLQRSLPSQHSSASWLCAPQPRCSSPSACNMPRESASHTNTSAETQWSPNSLTHTHTRTGVHIFFSFLSE